MVQHVHVQLQLRPRVTRTARTLAQLDAQEAREQEEQLQARRELQQLAASQVCVQHLHQRVRGRHDRRGQRRQRLELLLHLLAQHTLTRQHHPQVLRPQTQPLQQRLQLRRERRRREGLFLRQEQRVQLAEALDALARELLLLVLQEGAPALQLQLAPAHDQRAQLRVGVLQRHGSRGADVPLVDLAPEHGHAGEDHVERRGDGQLQQVVDQSQDVLQHQLRRVQPQDLEHAPAQRQQRRHAVLRLAHVAVVVEGVGAPRVQQRGQVAALRHVLRQAQLQQAQRRVGLLVVREHQRADLRLEVHGHARAQQRQLLAHGRHAVLLALLRAYEVLHHLVHVLHVLRADVPRPQRRAAQPVHLTLHRLHLRAHRLALHLRLRLHLLVEQQLEVGELLAVRRLHLRLRATDVLDVDAPRAELHFLRLLRRALPLRLQLLHVQPREPANELRDGRVVAALAHRHVAQHQLRQQRAEEQPLAAQLRRRCAVHDARHVRLHRRLRARHRHERVLREVRQVLAQRALRAEALAALRLRRLAQRHQQAHAVLHGRHGAADGVDHVAVLAVGVQQ